MCVAGLAIAIFTLVRAIHKRPWHNTVLLWWSAAPLHKHNTCWSHQRYPKIKSTTSKNLAREKKNSNSIKIEMNSPVFAHLRSFTTSFVIRICLPLLLFTTLFRNSIKRNYNCVFHVGDFATASKKWTDIWATCTAHNFFFQSNNVCQTLPYGFFPVCVSVICVRNGK